MAKPVPAKPSKSKPVEKLQPRSTTAGNTTHAVEHWIDQARRLANQGQVVEALKCCEQNWRLQPPSAEAFHLLGLLHDAAGRMREAAEYYRKALYLDPQHREALVHLAVALQKEGDEPGAQRLFERVNRQSAAGES